MNGLNFLCLLLFVTLASGHSSYKSKIPNGHNVKHPCTGEVWGAVGHMSSGYTPQKNVFGEVKFIYFHKLCFKNKTSILFVVFSRNCFVLCVSLMTCKE